MKKMLFIAATMFFLSCSSENEGNSSNLVSCRFRNGEGCEETFVSELEKNNMSVSDAQAGCEKEKDAQFSNEGCPSGSVVKCPYRDGANLEMVVHFYDERFKGKTCAQIWNSRDELWDD